MATTPRYDTSDSHSLLAIASGSFQMSQLSASGGHGIGVSASTSVPPRNSQDWSPLGWLDSITNTMDMGLGGLGSWWWTGRPGVLPFMGSQTVGHDWVTELSWTELAIAENISTYLTSQSHFQFLNSKIADSYFSPFFAFNFITSFQISIPFALWILVPILITTTLVHTFYSPCFDCQNLCPIFLQSYLSDPYTVVGLFYPKHLWDPLCQKKS